MAFRHFERYFNGFASTMSTQLPAQIKTVSSFSVAPVGFGDAAHAVVDQLKSWSVAGSFLNTDGATDSVMFVSGAVAAADCAAAIAAPLRNSNAHGLLAERFVEGTGLVQVDFAAGAATAAGPTAALRLCYRHGAEPYMVYDT
jgi:hypothetical protein